MSGPKIEVYMGDGGTLNAYVKMDGKKLDCVRKVEVTVEVDEPSEVRLTLCPVAVRIHGEPTQLKAYMQPDEPIPLPLFGEVKEIPNDRDLRPVRVSTPDNLDIHNDRGCDDDR